MKRLFTAMPLVFLLGCCLAGCAGNRDFNVLVFSKTEGYRHASIADGKRALLQLGQERGFRADTTEDAAAFTEANLKNYHVVVFLNTTGDVLDEAQQLAFTRFIQAGGGFVGIHAAADTEYDWPWYGRLVGAYFDGHPSNPNVREGALTVTDAGHRATKNLPARWQRADEWYDYRVVNPDRRVLLTVDERSYREEVRDEVHPMAWYHDFDGGRAFYTGLGHTPESYAEPFFLDHLWGGLRYAAGDARPVNFARATVMPVENRFTKVVLDQHLNEPMELDLLDDGRILFVERGGQVKIHDPRAGVTKTIARLDVLREREDGLLGVAVDPGYARNRWVYFFYSPPGDEPVQHVSRFVLRGDSLDRASEKVLLKIPVQREECCHAAGSLEFGPGGNLFIATGDNTNPFASDGFSPLDERPGRSAWDAQRSSANTNDLRGKILRIHPEPDGTYTIPAGNLFAGDTLRRPEIYTMGHRNPFRIAIDAQTGYLYWGDVGPDAGQDSPTRGPRGHDEVNQARRAGNFGWPYFIADNQPYHDYDFAEGTEGPPFDSAAPVNDSPNNTGARDLPPAQPAFLWYPYGKSAAFPVVGEGARTAMAGPVFYHAAYRDSGRRFPAYFDGKLFLYEWMRDWIVVVTMDAEGNLVGMERFLPGLELSNPIDLRFGPDGALYVLEYGESWNTQNLDARLSRIDYHAGNRAPVARIAADRTVGAAPLRVAFSGAASADPDGDALAYAWTFDDPAGTTSKEADPVITFAQPGRYRAALTVTDRAGERAGAEVEILVGNEAPAVSIRLDGNRTFFWEGEQRGYAVRVTDAEDGSLGAGIDPSRVAVSLDYLPQGHDLTLAAQGHEALLDASRAFLGKALMDGSDCAACHQPNAASIGPSYTAIAERYQGDAQAPEALAQKVIGGGGGVWGEQAMAAHPQLAAEEARQMVRYILSLADEGTDAARLPPQGRFAFARRDGTGAQGRYVVTASYTDAGGPAVGPLTGRAVVTLRAPRLEAEAFDDADRVTTASVPASTPGVDEAMTVVAARDGAHLVFKDIDLTGVRAVTARVGTAMGGATGGRIELRLDGVDGPTAGQVAVPPSAAPGVQAYAVEIQPTDGAHDLYFVFRSDAAGSQAPVCFVDWFYFHAR